MLPPVALAAFALAAVSGSPLALPLSAVAYASVVACTRPMDLLPTKETTR